MKPCHYNLPEPVVRAGIDPSTATPDDPVNIDVVAKVLSRSQATVRDLVTAGKFPAPDVAQPVIGRRRWVWKLATLVKALEEAMARVIDAAQEARGGNRE